MTLAETLQGAGYATACVTANAALAFKTGFDQGFGHFRVLAVEANAKARADAVNAAAFAWLDANAGRPAFLYLHYMEPHLPYSPSPEALDRVLGGRPRPDLKAASASMMMAITMPPTPERLRDIQDVYDAEVASLDDGLRALVAGLETRGVLRDALVVVTADHGEELQDHGGMGHGVSLYNELIEVPLVFARFPASSGRRVPEVVSLLDVAPTLVEAAGAPVPGSFEGRSLGSLLGPPAALDVVRQWLWPPAEPVAFSELKLGPKADPRGKRPHLLAVVAGRSKLIIGPKGERERYDLGVDAAEKTAVPEDAPGEDALRRTVAAFRTRVTGPAAPVSAELTPEQRERLKALGYVQ